MHVTSWFCGRAVLAGSLAGLALLSLGCSVAPVVTSNVRAISPPDTPGAGGAGSAGAPAAAAPQQEWTGRWRRDDGLVLEVRDDGQRVRGSLVQGSSGGFTSYAIDLRWEGSERLRGNATWTRAGLQQTTEWDLRVRGADTLSGSVQWVDYDPDTRQIVNRGAHTRTVTVTRPAAPPPPPEADIPLAQALGDLELWGRAFFAALKRNDQSALRGFLVTRDDCQSLHEGTDVNVDQTASIVADVFSADVQEVLRVHAGLSNARFVSFRRQPRWESPADWFGQWGRNVEIIEGGTIVYAVDGAEQSLTVRTIVHVGSNWKLYTLASPRRE